MGKGSRTDAKDPVDREHFNLVMWNYFEQLFYTQMDLIALQQLVVKAGNITEQEIVAAQEALRANQSCGP